MSSHSEVRAQRGRYQVFQTDEGNWCVIWDYRWLANESWTEAKSFKTHAEALEFVGARLDKGCTHALETECWKGRS